jgi:hypothetical protein
MPVKKQQECAPKTVWQMLLFQHDPGGLSQLLNNINKKKYQTQSAMQRMNKLYFCGKNDLLDIMSYVFKKSM